MLYMIVKCWLRPLHMVSQETARTCYEWQIQNLKWRSLAKKKLKEQVNK
jgi:hypothetical protein